MAREQYFRHFHASKIGWSRIMRVFQQTLAEGLFLRALIISQNSRQQPCDDVNQHHHRKSSVCEHIIPNAQIFVGEVLPHPFIKSFVTSRYQEEMTMLREFAPHSLRQLPPTRRH